MYTVLKNYIVYVQSNVKYIFPPFEDVSYEVKKKKNLYVETMYICPSVCDLVLWTEWFVRF
jgi:hypothetical protein